MFFIVKKDVLKGLKQALFSKLCQSVLEDLTDDSAVQLTEALSSLIKLTATAKGLSDLITNLPNALQKVDSFERYHTNPQIISM